MSMIRAIVWKELREQGLIALTLVVLGGGLIVAAHAFADPPSTNAAPTDIVRFLGIGQLATLMLAVTAGMVCGGAVFAAEREAATFSYLDSLPAYRSQIWHGKLIAGFGLALGQIVLLVGLGAALGLVPSIGRALAVTLYALLAFVWGMFGSTTARTTLGSVGIAIPAASITAFFVIIPVMVLFQSPGASVPRLGGAILFAASMFLIPLALSAWLFTSLDRTRAADGAHRLPSRISPDSRSVSSESRPTASTSTSPARRARRGLKALFWLTARQILLPLAALSAFAFLFGLALNLPPAQPFLTWPALALMAGVVTGVLAFADEQTKGAARYWSEQRLPIGRLWAIKIGFYLMLCGWLLFLVALPLIIRAQFEDSARHGHSHTFLASVFRSPLLDELGTQGWKYLFLPALWGFAAGHVCGLVFKKLVVACGVAAIVGGVGAALWGPSLLSGGVKHWQLWLPPLLLLTTGRVLMRTWVSERIPSRSAITTLVCGSGLALIVSAIGLAYRVLEIPDSDANEDDVAFVASLPPIEKNTGGRDFKSAAERFSRLASLINPTFDPLITGMNRRDRVEERAEQVLRSGWKEDNELARSLGRWLDRMFADAPPGADEPAWHESATAAAGYPIGIYEYPQLQSMNSAPALSLDAAKRMAIAFLARGLQRQNVDPSEFLRRFRTAIILAKTLRNGSSVNSYQAGLEIERSALLALDQWLDRLPANSGQFRPMLKVVALAEPSSPFDSTPYFLAERYVLREAMKSPGQWLNHLIVPPGGNLETVAPEVDLVAFAWAFPWERERTRRIVGLGFEAGLPISYSVVQGRPGVGLLIGRARSPKEVEEMERLMSSHRRAALLKVALRAYRAQEGEYPESLDALVRNKYLERLPDDPFANQQPFGYRISVGEELTTPPVRSTSERSVDPRFNMPPETFSVPHGQPILWSVGQDQIDQSGKSVPVMISLGLTRPQDLVYLVPTG
jgi:ABC-type transport system involved in multi-copper enzyme maturation permease subunit